MPNLAQIIKQQRIAMALTIRELATASGVSASHLGRIEREERFPSAHILGRIAKPLGLDEKVLFSSAGFLSSPLTDDTTEEPRYHISRLDPYVAKVLAEEPVERQRTIIGILNILKSLSQGANQE